MKEFLACTLFVFLTTTTACAQICIFACVIKDVTNASYQAVKLAELKSILTQVGEQTRLARDVRDATKRIREKERAFTVNIDRVTSIHESRSRIVNQIIRHFHDGNAITYRMDASQWNKTFAMGREPTDADYGQIMNVRSMQTVAGAMGTLQEIARETQENAQKLDELSRAFTRAHRIEERTSLEASIALLRARQKTLRQMLMLSEINLDASMNAVQVDAAANASIQQHRDQEDLRDYIHTLTRQ